jgi:hypothetical protein
MFSFQERFGCRARKLGIPRPEEGRAAAHRQLGRNFTPLNGDQAPADCLHLQFSYRNGLSERSAVVQPFVDEDKLSRIYINVDSAVLKDFNRAAKSTDSIEFVERRYVSSVYFHTLFLFATTKSRKYALQRGDGEAPVDVEVAEYIADLFSSSYAQFLLSFDTADLIDAIA